MKRVFAGTFVAAAFAVSLSAQQPPAQQPPAQSAPAQESKDAAKTVTVTGCLKAGDTADSFTLSDLKWSQDKAVGTSGAVTATPPITATNLKLTGNPSTKLSDHVGHTVEVTGTIGDKADKPMASADPASRPSASASASSPALNVRNVRMIAATCSAQ